MSPPADKSQQQRHHMQQALRLARRGLGLSSPNPAVGALVVKAGRVVGRGFHAKAGQPHAEVLALQQAGRAARGADLYVTLEPCHHQGRTPPCTQAILRSGVKRVIYGANDPNPGVAGGGGRFLAGRGVEVVAGVLGEACAWEHRFFFRHVTSGLPYVLLKTAATADGKTATASGDSRWVTGRDSRSQVHRLRRWLDAVCVGIGTALADDPQLTCRLRGGRDPLRVVVDSRLRLPPTARVLEATAGAGCLVACGPQAPQARVRRLTRAGAQVLSLAAGPQGGVDLKALLAELGRRGVTSLLLEGGAGLAWGFLGQGLVDEVAYFYAPKIVGGLKAPPMVAGPGVSLMGQAIELERPRVRRFGPDLMLQAQVRK